MIGRKKEQCFSPWFGYLVILAVCVIIASAIFFESKGRHWHRRSVKGAVPTPAAVQAAFPNPRAATGGTDEKLVF
ncbi:MAG: hypothetical protein HQL14_00820 [Candidatus Omnitrophica bacterium]|nr:hypothetical protein [Candidatus Omnitrophota bacterium]